MCFNFFKPKPPVVSPALILPRSSKRTTSAELEALLPRAETLFLSDNTFYLCHPEDIALFLAQDATNRLEYLAEDYDCDDFTLRLAGQFSIPRWSALAFGICWTDLHALNFFVDEDGKFWFVEPQSDEIQSQLNAWQGQNLRLLIV